MKPQEISHAKTFAFAAFSIFAGAAIFAGGCVHRQTNEAEIADAVPQANNAYRLIIDGETLSKGDPLANHAFALTGKKPHHVLMSRVTGFDMNTISPCRRHLPNPNFVAPKNAVWHELYAGDALVGFAALVDVEEKCEEEDCEYEPHHRNYFVLKDSCGRIVENGFIVHIIDDPIVTNDAHSDLEVGDLNGDGELDFYAGFTEWAGQGLYISKGDGEYEYLYLNNRNPGYFIRLDDNGSVFHLRDSDYMSFDAKEYELSRFNKDGSMTDVRNDVPGFIRILRLEYMEAEELYDLALWHREVQYYDKSKFVRFLRKAADKGHEKAATALRDVEE